VDGVSVFQRKFEMLNFQIRCFGKLFTVAFILG